MDYSIFTDTMADMTYTQIEKAAKEKMPILFPIAVIEEHGPHMCLGTDMYLTYNVCKKLRENLATHNINTLIAPPFYWGVNSITNGFPGSFVVKPETVITILCELLENLKSWGFDNIFLFSFHGDCKHIETIIEVAKTAYTKQNIGAYFVAHDLALQLGGFSEDVPYVLQIPTKPQIPSQYLDIHAGSLETSLMVKDFPKLVDINLAKTLKSSFTTYKDIRNWIQGGEKAKEITPLGYCGNPSEFDLQKTVESEDELKMGFTEAICKFLDR